MDPPEKRFNCGWGYYRNDYFWRAIKKYGWKNFKTDILFSDLTTEEAEQKEIELIAEYHSNDKRYGYNLSAGGENKTHPSEETRRKMSRSRIGKGTGKRNLSPETRKLMHDHHAGGTEPKSVFCVETGEVFNSINDAARKYKINKKQISGCCRKREHFNTAGGYHWKFVNTGR